MIRNSQLFRIPAAILTVAAAFLSHSAIASSESLLLSHSTTSTGTSGQGSSTNLAVPASYTYANSFSSLNSNVSGTNYEFYDDFVFTVTNSFANSITSTINLANSWGITDLQVRLYNATLQSNLPVFGTPVGGVIEAWSSPITVGNSTGIISILDTVALNAGTYSLQIRGNIFGNYGGGYSGTLNVSDVPVPAALWLFGSAIASLSVARRQRAV